MVHFQQDNMMLCVWSQAFNRPIYNLWGLEEENLEIPKSAKLFRLVQMKWDCGT